MKKYIVLSVYYEPYPHNILKKRLIVENLTYKTINLYSIKNHNSYEVDKYENALKQYFEHYCLLNVKFLDRTLFCDSSLWIYEIQDE